MKKSGHKPSRSSSSFLQKILGSGVAITMVIFGLISWSVWSFYNSFSSEVSAELHYNRQASEMLYLNEVMTLSARIAAETGGVEWESRYLESHSQLDSSLRALSARMQNGRGYEAMQRLARTGKALKQAEIDVFRANRLGERASARTILADSVYRHRQSEYQADIRTVSDLAYKNILEKLEAYRLSNLIILFFTFNGLLLMGAIWLTVVFVVNKYDRQRIVAEQELQKAKDGLEDMVADRTEDLNSSNIHLRQEIEERKRVEAQLVEAREEAEAVSRAKSAFLANISHEIRTPMNGIIGMTELALETRLSDEQRDYIDIVRSSAGSLLSIINDILDFSKIEAGKMSLDPINFHLRSNIDDVFKTLALRAGQRGLIFEPSVDPAVPDHVHGDPTRLRQVLINLLGNAVKFTEEGSVRLNVTVHEKDGRRLALHFQVIDSGIGIPEEKQGVIFDAFSQADNSTTRDYGGTGLGLAICSQLVGLLDGKIWLESPNQREETLGGNGSTFHFIIMLETAAQDDVDPMESAVVEQRDIPIALVDIQPESGTALCESLTRMGMSVDLISRPEQILPQLCRASDNNTPYRLILLDHRLPHINAFETAQQIRSDKRLSHIVMAMLPEMGDLGDGARCREHGISAYVPKPVTSDELLQMITAIQHYHLLGRRGDGPLITRHGLREKNAGSAPPQLAPAGTPEPGDHQNGSLVESAPATEGSDATCHILLVEDNIVNQKLAMRLLEKMGYMVTIANNGREALDLWQDSQVNLILMDLQMPVMDGFEATAAIRHHEAQLGGHIPIVALTANAMPGDREKCLDAGMDEYVSKPIKRKLLQEAIKQFIN